VAAAMSAAESSRAGAGAPRGAAAGPRDSTNR
jgi:hypothetical protein